MILFALYSLTMDMLYTHHYIYSHRYILVCYITVIVLYNRYVLVCYITVIVLYYCSYGSKAFVIVLSFYV